jgi:hypothetical protein
LIKEAQIVERLLLKVKAELIDEIILIMSAKKKLNMVKEPD